MEEIELRVKIGSFISSSPLLPSPSFFSLFKNSSLFSRVLLLFSVNTFCVTHLYIFLSSFIHFLGEKSEEKKHEEKKNSRINIWNTAKNHDEGSNFVFFWRKSEQDILCAGHEDHQSFTWNKIIWRDVSGKKSNLSLKSKLNCHSTDRFFPWLSHMTVGRYILIHLLSFVDATHASRLSDGKCRRHWLLRSSCQTFVSRINSSCTPRFDLRLESQCMFTRGYQLFFPAAITLLGKGLKSYLSEGSVKSWWIERRKKYDDYAGEDVEKGCRWWSSS